MRQYSKLESVPGSILVLDHDGSAACYSASEIMDWDDDTYAEHLWADGGAIIRQVLHEAGYTRTTPDHPDDTDEEEEDPDDSDGDDEQPELVDAQREAIQELYRDYTAFREEVESLDSAGHAVNLLRLNRIAADLDYRLDKARENHGPQGEPL